jgi:hypothetical protein
MMLAGHRLEAHGAASGEILKPVYGEHKIAELRDVGITEHIRVFNEAIGNECNRAMDLNARCGECDPVNI